MTSRTLWDDARETAKETTRELFAPLTFVFRVVTASGKSAHVNASGGKRKWYAQPVGKTATGKTANAAVKPLKVLRAHRNRLREPHSESIRG